MAKINISIPKPCHENWEGMTNAEKGKFCNSCQKKVFDFTTASDREIVKAFQQNNQLCGRFLDTQLNRDLVSPKQRKSIWFATPATIISILGIGTYEAKAQEPVKTEQTPEHIILGKPAYIEPKEIEISGVVLDDNKLPLPGVTIYETETENYTQTDVEGRFSIKIKKGSYLKFIYTGFYYELKKFDRTEKISITLKESEHLMGEVVIMKKRTFLGRIFQSIGNLFR